MTMMAKRAIQVGRAIAHSRQLRALHAVDIMAILQTSEKGVLIQSVVKAGPMMQLGRIPRFGGGVWDR
jgi:hypothetical protein